MDEDRMRMGTDEFYLKSPEEMIEYLKVSGVPLTPEQDYVIVQDSYK